MTAHEGALGDWRWHYGLNEDDDEMMDCGTREDAILAGVRDHKPGESFWIVEARYLIADEDAMGNGERDAAPFADTRSGEWITVEASDEH